MSEHKKNLKIFQVTEMTKHPPILANMSSHERGIPIPLPTLN